MHRIQPIQLDRFTMIECLGLWTGVEASAEGPNRNSVAPAATEESRNCLLVTVLEFFDDLSGIFDSSFLDLSQVCDGPTNVLEFG